MRYYRADEIENLLVKLIEARSNKAGCSKSAAQELSIYQYMYNVIRTLQTYDL